MKKRIYIYPDEPTNNQLLANLEDLDPALAEAVRGPLIRSFEKIRRSLRESSINGTRYTYNTSTFSDGKHSITLIGRMDRPTFLQIFKDWWL